jgi:transcriptional regulator with XRE-family HTH domain
VVFMSRMADNTPMTTQRPDSNDLPQHDPHDLLQQLITFGAALKDAYEGANVSKRQLAASASLDRSAITRIEQGRQAPKFDKLLLLARGARTTPAALLAGIESLTGVGRTIEPDGGEPPSERDPAKRFAANLRWIREHLDPSLTQEGLALEAKIDHSSPNGYETGRMAPPTLRTILKLAAGLGVPPSLLMEGVLLD